MNLWVCSFPRAEHPRLGYFAEHKPVFRVSSAQISSGEVKHCAVMSALETESARDTAGSRASPTAKAAERLCSVCTVI